MTCAVPVIVRDDVEAAADEIRPHLALYIGGMGARDLNFHHEVFVRLGYEAEAKRIQDLYLDGKRMRRPRRCRCDWWRRSRW